MSELDEIMEGKHKIKHLHIEGDTIAFNTELDNYNWNLTPRDIEIIIYCLQNELDKYKQVIDKIKELLEKYNDNEANRYAPIKECLEILEEIE